MSEELRAILNDDGVFEEYDDTYDLTIHCENEEEQEEVLNRLNWRWIPVSERLPDKVGTYMTTVDYEKYGIAVGQRYYHGEGIGWEDDCVIAWMPLPEPYKADKEEEE